MHDDVFLPGSFHFGVPKCHILGATTMTFCRVSFNLWCLGFTHLENSIFSFLQLLLFVRGSIPGCLGFIPPWKFHILAFAIIVFLAGFYSGVFESYPPSECHIFDCTAMKFITEATLTGG